MKRMEAYALNIDVLAVAVEGTVGDWAAYIKAVPGNNHEKEKENVAHYGNKLRYDIAKILFPRWDATLVWRD